MHYGLNPNVNWQIELQLLTKPVKPQIKKKKYCTLKLQPLVDWIYPS